MSDLYPALFVAHPDGSYTEYTPNPLADLEHTRQIVAAQEETEWTLLAELWAIADLTTAESQHGAEMALRALERRNRATDGAVWRRFARLDAADVPTAREARA